MLCVSPVIFLSCIILSVLFCSLRLMIDRVWMTSKEILSVISQQHLIIRSLRYIKKFSDHHNNNSKNFLLCFTEKLKCDSCFKKRSAVKKADEPQGAMGLLENSVKALQHLICLTN